MQIVIIFGSRAWSIWSSHKAFTIDFIYRVLIRSIEGVRIASTTSIQMLLKSDFDLVINDFVYRVQPPPFEVSTGLSTLDDNEVKRMGDVRALVGELYEVKYVIF